MGRLDKRLKRKDWVPYIPEHPDTVRINHDYCPAGRDTRRRLYITKKEDGSGLAYCHNCGCSGFRRATGTYRAVRPTDLTTEYKDPPGKEHTLEGLITRVIDWPQPMKDWLRECGLTLTSAIKRGIAYDGDNQRIVIPHWDEDGTLMGYQSRRLYDDGSPKYITYRNQDYHHVYMRGKKIPNVCIIVEDMISAHRVHALGYSALSLNTSHMAESSYLTLARNHDIIIVWLDNDSVEVQRSAIEIGKKLTVMGTPTSVKKLKDPKHFSNSDIVREVVTTIGMEGVKLK